MKNVQDLMEEITQLTSNIEANYPELYHFLDENPVTIPSKAHQDIDTVILEDYLESLKRMLRQHVESHKK